MFKIKMNILISQFFGILAALSAIIGIQFKTKEKILLFQVIANSFDALQFFFAGDMTGGCLLIVIVLRCFVFYYYDRHNMKPSVFFLVLFNMMVIVTGTITWTNIYSIIPMILSIMYTYALWQEDVRITRIATMFSAGGWVIYDLIVNVYIGAIQSFCEFVSSIFSMYRHRKEECEKDKLIVEAKSA